jgi:hypothetical protein
MAFSQSDLTTLEAAIASGVLEVRYGDKTVRYNTVTDMLQLRDRMRCELAGSTTQSRRTTLAAFRGA